MAGRGDFVGNAHFHGDSLGLCVSRDDVEGWDSEIVEVEAMYLHSISGCQDSVVKAVWEGRIENKVAPLSTGCRCRVQLQLPFFLFIFFALCVGLLPTISFVKFASPLPRLKNKSTAAPSSPRACKNILCVDRQTHKP